MHLDYDTVYTVGLQALKNVGVPCDNAHIQLQLLLEAELRGIASHGILRLPRIIKRLQNGVSSPTATGHIHWFSTAMGRMDGQHGLGPVVGLHALTVGISKAKQLGVSTIAIKNCGHLGMLAFYAEKIANDGLVGICLTTSEALVHPWGGRHAMIGTNPIAIGVPTAHMPFVMDMATSCVAMGKIHDYANRNTPIPKQWALDKNGNATTNPHKAKHGAIAPFGGAKGYALGLGFEMIVTALAGSAIGTDVVGTLDDDTRCNKGDVFIILSPDTGAYDTLSAYITALKNTAPVDPNTPVRIPGERGHMDRKNRLHNGFEIPDSIWNTLVAYAKI